MAPGPAMRVIVTRPEREASAWVSSLRERGFDAISLPLIDIEPLADTQPLRQCWQRLPEFAALMFVSANAVSGFFDARPAERAAWGGPQLRTRAWATGPATAQALTIAGVPAGQIDAPPAASAQFDSETLWQGVAAQARPGARVLIVRGAGPDGQATGRDWLASQLAQAGVRVETVAAYVRRVPRWTPSQQEIARSAAGDGAVWLFSSSEAVAHLGRLLPGQSWASARAVASHERIAQAARAAGFGVVCPSRPDLPAIARALESIR